MHNPVVTDKPNLYRMKDLRKVLPLGEKTLRELGFEANARVCVGTKCVLYDLNIITEYLAMKRTLGKVGA